MGTWHLDFINKSDKAKDTVTIKEKLLKYLETESRLLYPGLEIEGFNWRTINKTKETLDWSIIKITSQKDLAKKGNIKTVEQTQNDCNRRINDFLKGEN